MTKYLLPSGIGALCSRLGSLSWLRTIRSRLFFAFGLAASMTVVGSLLSQFLFTEVSRTLNEIVFQSMPATVESFRLLDEANRLVGSAPRLMAAEDENHRVEIAGEIATQSRNLETQIARLGTLDASESDEIAVAKTNMNERLSALNKAVADRINISERRRTLAKAVRSTHESLLEAIVPVIDDANFDLMTRDQIAGNGKELNQSIESLRRLLEVQADANLLTGLLIESSMVTDIGSIPPIRDLIASAERRMDSNLKALPDSAQRARIADLYGKLAALGGNAGIIVQRINELKGEQDAQKSYAAALADATRLRSAVENLIKRQGSIAQTLSARAVSQIDIGRIILLLLCAAAFAAAGLIAWFYVGRSIVRRLTLLSSAMRGIAAGETNVPIPVEGQDEIAGMAQALIVFRQAIEDVTLARQSEADRAQSAELRRHKIEIATQNFERAVNDITEALDAASKTMDNCAQIMTEAAGHNQTQADATTTASKAATTNVSNVAGAAEEIALSVEEILRRARNSAQIAHKATDQAKSIIDTVERLATTVGQIGNVSDLIRNVASQTNLLALNATIEAARAGDAGRGFAVVAQEVKSLAAQTEKATGDIAQQILSIESTTLNVVRAMEGVAGTISELDENANDISAAVQQQDAFSKEIARSANAAADSTREVSTRVVQVSEAASKTAQVAKAVLDAGSELSAKSDRLRTEVEGFLNQVRVA